jgi:hypothetical protein
MLGEDHVQLKNRPLECVIRIMAAPMRLSPRQSLWTKIPKRSIYLLIMKEFILYCTLPSLYMFNVVKGITKQLTITAFLCKYPVCLIHTFACEWRCANCSYFQVVFLLDKTQARGQFFVINTSARKAAAFSLIYTCVNIRELKKCYENVTGVHTMVNIACDYTFVCT